MHDVRALTATRKRPQQEAAGRARRAFGKLYGGMVEVPRSAMRAYRRWALERSTVRALESVILGPEAASARLGDVEEEISGLEDSLKLIRRLETSLKEQRGLERTKNVSDERSDALGEEIKGLEQKCESILAQTSAEVELGDKACAKMADTGIVLGAVSFLLALPDFVNAIRYHLGQTLEHAASGPSTFAYVGVAGMVSSIVLMLQFLSRTPIKKAALVKKAKDHLMERIRCLEVDRGILEEQECTDKRLIGQELP